MSRLVGRYRLPRIEGQPSQATAAERAIDKLTDDVNERALLRVFVSHADGAGACFVTLRRLTEQAGIGCKRTVQRTRARLVERELLEVYPSRRDPARYSDRPHYRARQGSGPNWYRLGADLRRRAGYVEVDVIESYGSAPARPQIASVSPPSWEPVTPEIPGRVTPEIGDGRVMPECHPRDTDKLPAISGVTAAARVTPRTENYRAADGEERLVPSRGEGTRSHLPHARRPALGEHGYQERMLDALARGLITELEFGQALKAHALVAHVEGLAS